MRTPGGLVTPARRCEDLLRRPDPAQCEHDLDKISGSDATVASPRCAEHDPVAVGEHLDRRAHTHPVDGAMDPVV
jgi:hypothetical protein